MKSIVATVYIILSIDAIILYFIACNKLKKYEENNENKYYKQTLIIFKIALITFIIGLLTLIVGAFILKI